MCKHAYSLRTTATHQFRIVMLNYCLNTNLVSHICDKHMIQHIEKYEGNENKILIVMIGVEENQIANKSWKITAMAT